MNRRNFFGGAAMTAVAAASVSRVAMAALPEPMMMGKPDTAPPLIQNTGPTSNPFGTLIGGNEPMRTNQSTKELQMVAAALEGAQASD